MVTHLESELLFRQLLRIGNFYKSARWQIASVLALTFFCCRSHLFFQQTFAEDQVCTDQLGILPWTRVQSFPLQGLKDHYGYKKMNKPLSRDTIGVVRKKDRDWIWGCFTQISLLKTARCGLSVKWKYVVHLFRSC